MLSYAGINILRFGLGRSEKPWSISGNPMVRSNERRNLPRNDPSSIEDDCDELPQCCSATPTATVSAALLVMLIGFLCGPVFPAKSEPPYSGQIQSPAIGA
ncbi:hypothetical protein BJX68DRAFT_78367 [Aspergillus pseudodeflectus]|uniref:Uncharacterized protein n=1 Tax=Aspergillus pseudodeflectus TaxID=176178 RepID=A0ABR4L7F8_9EURO